MISLHYTSHTKAYNTIYTACNIVEAIYSFTPTNKTFCIYAYVVREEVARMIFLQGGPQFEVTPLR